MIAIVNYGLGNLHSVKKAVEKVGGRAIVTEDANTILKSKKIILPGVGAFRDGMSGLKNRNLAAVIRNASDSGKPILGICLGMQLLFDESEEQGHASGLGLIGGKVVFFDQQDIKVPQIGWNQLYIRREESFLMRGMKDGNYVYFNHSYYCVPEDQSYVVATTDYGTNFASIVQKDNVFGVQFHPEKSQKIGLRILKNFIEESDG